MKLRGNSIFNMCLKRNSEEKVEALDQMVEETTSFEKLSQNLISMMLVNRYVFHPNIQRIAPTIRLMKKMIDTKETETSLPTHNDHNQSSEESATDSDFNSMRDVYAMIQSIPENSSMNIKLKKQFLTVFHSFHKHFQNESIDGIFSGEILPDQRTAIINQGTSVSPSPFQSRNPALRGNNV